MGQSAVIPVCAGIGTALGAGVALESIALGAGIGAGLGAALGVVGLLLLSRRGRRGSA